MPPIVTSTEIQMIGSGSQMGALVMACPSALRVDGAAGAAVEAQRLHDLERCGRGELGDVGGGQHAGVLGDDGCGRAFGDGVEVAFDPGPDVLAARYVVGHRVAKETANPPAQVALSWVINRPGVVSAIVGARNTSQLAGNLAAADLHLDPDTMATLETASDPHPAPYPYGPFGSAQRDRTANGPEALGQLIRGHANAAKETSDGVHPAR